MYGASLVPDPKPPRAFVFRKKRAFRAGVRLGAMARRGDYVEPAGWQIEVALVHGSGRKDLATFYFESRKEALLFMGRVYGVRPKDVLIGLRGWFPRPKLRCAKHRKAVSR